MTTTQPYFNANQGVILFDAEQKRYYNFDAVAATVWTLIQHPMTLKELAEAVADRFGLEKDVAERDVEQLLHRMTIEGLVEVEQD